MGVCCIIKPVRPVSPADTLECGIQNLAIQIDSTFRDSFLGILVDDCSKDGTVQMIREFMKDIRPKRPVIFLQNEKNSGVCAARNAGVKAAGGEYICYLDSDDFWTNDKIRKQISLLAAYEAAALELVKGKEEAVHHLLAVGCVHDIMYYLLVI